MEIKIDNENYLLCTEWSSTILAGEIPRAFLGVQAAITDIIRRIMSTEEEFPRVIRQSYSLRRYFEMDYRRSGQRFLFEHSRDRFLNCLRPCQ